MFWQENSKLEDFTLPDCVQDAVFSIRTKILPMDHAYLLKVALLAHLPWLAALEDSGAGVHDISIADGNGWQQDRATGFYYPSKRSKLSIRLPKEKLAACAELVGKTLELGEYQIQILKMESPKLLQTLPVLLAKNVACAQNMDEDGFLQCCFDQLGAMGVVPKKMLAGLSHQIHTSNDIIHTRALMVADLRKMESVRLQEKGIGAHRLLGCGLFVPQKEINPIDG